VNLGSEPPPLTPVEQKGPIDLNAYPLDKIICDSFATASPSGPGMGVIANIFYLPKDSAPAANLAEAFAEGVRSERQLFLAQVNIPTREWAQGFTDGLGQGLKDESGEPLSHSFALKLRSTLRLAPTDAPGLYEFALLSDDGAVLRLRGSDGEFRTVVDGDGSHPTRLSCSSRPGTSRTVELTPTSELALELDYHQGPSRPMALVLLMRKVEASDGPDPACDREGEGLWFKGGEGTEPKADYLELLARGWKPLAPENFALPQGALYNPCVEGRPPRVSDLKMEEETQDGFRVSWNTDIPAMSQLSAFDLATGHTTLTASDNILRLHHSLVVSGLRPDVPYALSAVVVSESLGKGISRPIQARTRHEKN
jgi:hypothetical protein